MEDTSRVLGWAVVGTGQISQLIVSDLSRVPGARRRGVCSRSGERGRAFADAHGFEVAHGSWAAVLDDAAVDIVYVGTPHATHADLAIEAMRAGKHVLIEKPIAVDAAEAARIAAVAEESGRFAMEAMWMRFSPAYRAALVLCRSGALGEVRSVRASFGLPFGSPDSERWSADRASSTLLDQGVYPVTLALDVLGPPDAVAARGRIRPDGVDLAGHITFDYADGRFAQLGASMVEYLEPTATISGSDGWLTLRAPFWGGASTLDLHAGSIPDALSNPSTSHFEPEGFGYTPMLAAVQAAVVSGRPGHPQHPLADSVTTLDVLDRIRRRLTDHDPTPLENP